MTSASMVAEKQRGSAKVWVVVFFVLLFFFLVGLSRVVYSPVSKTITGFTPGSSGGDDAHYLLTVNSLLFDGDLQLQEDYRRALEGGWGAGMRQRWVPLEHHTLLVDPVTKEHQYFSSVFRGDPYRFCAAEECRIYLKEWKLFSNPDAVVEFLAHPIGFPVMVAGLLYPTFPGPEQTEARMNLLIIFFSWLGAVLVYLTARRLGLGTKHSLVAAILLVFASPWLAYSRAYFSEPWAGVFLMAGLWAMIAGRPAWAGVACVLAFTTKLPYLLVGLGWILERLMARRFRDAAILTTVLGVGAVAFCLFNYWQTGAMLAGGHVDPSKVWGPFRPLRTLLDWQYGLLPFVPWAAVSLFAVGRVFFKKDISPLRLMFFPILFYWLLLTFHRPLGETCYGPRYWIPFLPWLALAAAAYAAKGGKVAKLVTYYLALLGAAAALPAGLAYPHAWNQPPPVPLIWLFGI